MQPRLPPATLTHWLRSHQLRAHARPTATSKQSCRRMSLSKHAIAQRVLNRVACMTTTPMRCLFGTSSINSHPMPCLHAGSTRKPVKQHVQLPTGYMMPHIGLGVYKTASGRDTYRSVLSALHLGYRLVDTAQVRRTRGRLHASPICLDRQRRLWPVHPLCQAPVWTCVCAGWGRSVVGGPPPVQHASPAKASLR